MKLDELFSFPVDTLDADILDLRALEYVSNYDDHLMCPICICAYIRPLRLPCNHTFCQDCLGSTFHSFISSLPDDYDSDWEGGNERTRFRCPSCRAPATEAFMDVPRVLNNMCDEIRVKCPFSSAGCVEVVTRGHVQAHVEKYCSYKLVDCPSEACDKKTRRKDLDAGNNCVHEFCRCSHCEEDIMVHAFEEHVNKLCPSLETMCPYCQIITLQRDLKTHIDICPEAIHPCTASKYGCQVKVKRADLATHEQTCPLIAMSPYLEAQNSRINSLELSVLHLRQRNEIFEDGLANIVSTLRRSSRNLPSQDASSSSDTSNDNSANATDYLLSVHESLRGEVVELSHAITDLDARASMAIMNECLRIKEDMAHTNAAVNSVRMQVQWLMNPRLHQGQRTAASSMQTGDTNAATNTAGQLRATSTSPAPGPSRASGPSSELRPRRLSDSAREGTKL